MKKYLFLMMIAAIMIGSTSKASAQNVPVKKQLLQKMKLKELNLQLTISLFGKKLFMYWHLKSVQNFSSKAKRKICSGMKGGFLCI
jgi:hypothetical protein